MPQLPWRRLRPQFVTARVEPSGAELVDEATIAELDEEVWLAWRRGWMSRVDYLLDERNAIRAPRPLPVPVVPGPRRGGGPW